MAAPTGLHLRGLPLLVHRCMWKCVFACTSAARVYHTSAFRRVCVCTHSLLCALHCVCVCARACIMTVILYDRMITPFSPQLRGVSPLHSSPSTAPQELCASTYVKASFLWAAMLLCVSFSSLSACPHNLRSLSDAKQLSRQKSYTGEHMDPITWQH